MARPNRSRQDDEGNSLTEWGYFEIGSERGSEGSGLVRTPESSPVSVYLAGGNADSVFAMPSWRNPAGGESVLSGLSQDGVRSLGCINPNCRDRSEIGDNVSQGDAPTQGHAQIQAEAEDEGEEIAYRPSFKRIAAWILWYVFLGAIIIGWLYWREFE